MATNIPETTLKTIHETTKEFVKAASIQNQVVLANIDATQQNINYFNANAKTFADHNRNSLQTWSYLFNTKTN